MPEEELVESEMLEWMALDTDKLVGEEPIKEMIC